MIACIEFMDGAGLMLTFTIPPSVAKKRRNEGTSPQLNINARAPREVLYEVINY